MTAKSTKGRPAAEGPGKKKVRRVRVIEVIDDDDDGEDLDEVLDALDKAEALENTDTLDDEADDEADAGEDDEAAPAKPARKPAAARRPKPSRGPEPEPSRLRAVLGSSRTTAALVIVLIAALATVAIWQWRQAARLAAEQDDRRDVAKVAGAYGDSAFDYTAATYKQTIDRNMALLGGDLLATYKQDTVPNLPTVFAKNPQLVMESTVRKVYVGDVNGRLATAVILVDIKLQTPQGTNDGSNALLRLSLAKDAGGWKVTQQAASGQSDDAASQVPTLPNASGTPGPSSSPTAKPKK